MNPLLSTYPSNITPLPTINLTSGKYRVRMAANRDELEAVLRLRYEIFNLEMGEGLEESNATGMDEDLYDEGCHHLLIEHLPTETVVGTYRLQTAAMAADHRGWYSANEYDLREMPDPILEHAIEVGRACIHQQHRSGRVLFLLWKGLAEYMKASQVRYLFGCCSLTSQHAEDGLVMLEALDQKGYMHPDIRLKPQPGYECLIPDDEVRTFPTVKMPRLMKIYLNYSATICSEPAVDRLFKTIDFLTLMDTRDIESSMYTSLFG